MTPDAYRTEIALAWQKFMADTKLSPDQLTDQDRMLFQVAYTMGYEASLKSVASMMKKEPAHG